MGPKQEADAAPEPVEPAPSGEVPAEAPVAEPGQIIVTAHVKLNDLPLGVPVAVDDSPEMRSAAIVGLVTISE